MAGVFAVRLCDAWPRLLRWHAKQPGPITGAQARTDPMTPARIILLILAALGLSACGVPFVPLI